MKGGWKAALLFAGALVTALPAWAQAGRPIVAVMEIEAVGLRMAPAMRDRLTVFLSGRLGASGKYQVVPREQVKARLIELKRSSYKECYAESCQIELGQALAAQKTISTQLVKLGSRCTVTVNVMDLKREASEGGATIDGGCDETGLGESLKAVVEELTGVGSLATGTARGAGPQASGRDSSRSGDAQSAAKSMAAAKARFFEWLRADLEQDGRIRDVGAIEAGYRAACSDGYAPACRSSEWHHSDGVSLEEAGRSFEDACQQKDEPSACTVVGWSLSQKAGGRGAPDRGSRDPARAAVLFQQACDRGFLPACVKLAWLHEAGIGVEKNLPQAVDLDRQACNGGELRGCVHLGAAYERGVGVAKDEAQALPWYRRACDGGEPTGCERLGAMYANGTGGVAKDEGKAIHLFRQACDGGEPAGCNRLGDVYAGGKGAVKDEAQAARLYQVACDSGELKGCTSLGLKYARGKGVPVDLDRSFRLFLKACEAGELQGCIYVSFLYLYGTGVAKDGSKATEYMKKACNGGSLDGCGYLGMNYMMGLGVAKNIATGISILQKACDNEGLLACVQLAVAYDGIQFKNDVAADGAKAASLYRRACDKGFAGGCEGLGLMYKFGRGVAKDPGRALQLLRQACESDARSGCGELALMYQEGVGVEVDYAQAWRLLRQSCDAEDASGCNNLGVLYDKGLGVARDVGQAAEFYRKSCNLGQAQGCKNLQLKQR